MQRRGGGGGGRRQRQSMQGRLGQVRGAGGNGRGQKGQGSGQGQQPVAAAEASCRRKMLLNRSAERRTWERQGAHRPRPCQCTGTHTRQCHVRACGRPASTGSLPALPPSSLPPISPPPPCPSTSSIVHIVQCACAWTAGLHERRCRHGWSNQLPACLRKTRLQTLTLCTAPVTAAHPPLSARTSQAHRPAPAGAWCSAWHFRLLTVSCTDQQTLRCSGLS